MNPETIFVTRYVASHDASLAWYERFFGRPADARPMPNCREWRLAADVFFQVIELPRRKGETSVAFSVPDLDAQADRLWDAGIALDAPSGVEGSTTMCCTRTCDPEGVALGLLKGG